MFLSADLQTNTFSYQAHLAFAADEASARVRTVSTTESKGQLSPMVCTHTCHTLNGALHSPTTMNECAVIIVRVVHSYLPPEHTLHRACCYVHIGSNYNVARIVRCTGQHTDINLNSREGFQRLPCRGLGVTEKIKSVELLHMRLLASLRVLPEAARSS